MAAKKQQKSSGQGDLFGTAYVDQPDTIKHSRNETQKKCKYVFVDLITPTLRCIHHGHRVILVDPQRNMRNIAELIRRGELELTEAERYTQLSIQPRKIVSAPILEPLSGGMDCDPLVALR